MRIGIFLILFLWLGCSEERRSEDYNHETSGMGRKEFLIDSKKCENEKDKFSNKIQGREFGFKGEHTGYLGCMKLKGWTQKVMVE